MKTSGYFAAPYEGWDEGWFGPSDTAEGAIKEMQSHWIDGPLKSCVTCIGRFVTKATHPDLYDGDEKLTEWDYQVEPPYRHHDLRRQLVELDHSPNINFRELVWDGPWRVLDDGDPHGQVFLVSPSGSNISVGSNDDQTLDIKRALWMASALNKAMGITNPEKLKAPEYKPL